MRSLGYEVMRRNMPKYVVSHTYITLNLQAYATSKPDEAEACDCLLMSYENIVE